MAMPTTHTAQAMGNEEKLKEIKGIEKKIVNSKLMKSVKEKLRIRLAHHKKVLK